MTESLSSESLSSERDFARVIDLSGPDRFRQLVSCLPDGVVVVGRDDRVRYLNPAAEDLLGRRARDVIGDSLGLSVQAGTRSEVELPGPDGRSIVVELRVAEIEWDGESALAASLRDVTHRSRLVKEQDELIGRLQELDDLKTEFVSIVSHDLRSPMATIAGFADTLRNNWNAFDDRHKMEILARISRSTNQLSKLVENILQVSQIESGRLSFDLRPLDMKSLVQRIVEENSRLVAGTEQARSIVARVPEDLPPVRADEIAQWQVLTNLVSNALKFSPSDASVEIDVSVSGGEVQVSVMDRGRGIRARDVDKLFRKFSRLEQPVELRVKGSGLGLYICKAMVEGQGGRIWVESEPGRGSTFSYTIPCA